jgi:hypothetical protein
MCVFKMLINPLQGMYTVKKVIVFPVTSRDVTNQTIPGQGEFD